MRRAKNERQQADVPAQEACWLSFLMPKYAREAASGRFSV